MPPQPRKPLDHSPTDTRTLPSGCPRTETLSSRVQAAAKSVPASLVCAHAMNVKMPSDLQPVDVVGDLAILARLVDARTQICVPRHKSQLPRPSSPDLANWLIKFKASIRHSSSI